MPEDGTEQISCDGCETTDCDNWRWSCWHGVTLCRTCADYWEANDGEFPDADQMEVTDFAA